ncbi:hypothetical protein DdX_08590 [Ditylenchus destructor]|uniref:Uncharacterized protein n=1 Tax=Ditylenchus destructor TaxID=166010 RepID=A0AAD4N5P8_9BILA|nr:hypothetical protein DdX_08590 [Ditylenchus destructor]
MHSQSKSSKGQSCVKYDGIWAIFFSFLPKTRMSRGKPTTFTPLFYTCNDWRGRQAKANHLSNNSSLCPEWSLTGDLPPKRPGQRFGQTNGDNQLDPNRWFRLPTTNGFPPKLSGKSKWDSAGRGLPLRHL